MPRNMSFALTTQQILNRTKTVTRRLGWKNLKPGEEFWAVRKAMGLKPGEKIERLALLRCKSNKTEVLRGMGKRGWMRASRECYAEGFPRMTPTEFVEMFCKHMKVNPDAMVQRIEFEYVRQLRDCPRCGQQLVLTPAGEVACVKLCLPPRQPFDAEEYEAMRRKGLQIEKPKHQLRQFGAAMKEYHSMFAPAPAPQGTEE